MDQLTPEMLQNLSNSFKRGRDSNLEVSHQQADKTYQKKICQIIAPFIELSSTDVNQIFKSEDSPLEHIRGEFSHTFVEELYILRETYEIGMFFKDGKFKKSALWKTYLEVAKDDYAPTIIFKVLNHKNWVFTGHRGTNRKAGRLRIIVPAKNQGVDLQLLPLTLFLEELKPRD